MTKAHALTNQGHLRAKAAKAELKLCRGFSCDPGTTADRTTAPDLDAAQWVL